MHDVIKGNYEIKEKEGKRDSHIFGLRKVRRKFPHFCLIRIMLQKGGEKGKERGENGEKWRENEREMRREMRKRKKSKWEMK